MGAVKKHIHKLLAVFLSACLLVSYNPAFDAVDSAFADETANDGGTHIYNGFSQDELDAKVAESAQDEEATKSWDRDRPGNMTTIIEASTFDSTLRTSCRDPFSATIEQIKAGKVGDVDVSYIWVEVTGGIPHENMDPYDSIWEAFDNDESAMDINWHLWDGEFITWTVNNDVANYHIDIQAMAEAGLLQDNHKYTFLGAFEDSTGSSVYARVTLYTIDYDELEFKHQIIPGKPGTDVEGTQIEGMISVKPKPELIGSKVPDTNPAKQAMEQKTAEDTMKKEGDGDYVLGNVLQLVTDPRTIWDKDGLAIPPYYEDGLILRLPVDPKYAYHETDNPSGYKEGDTITMLWAGDDSGKVVPVKATIVRGDDGVLRAEVPYPYAGDKDGDGVDDTGWPPLPGYFALQYDTNKLPSTGEDDDPDAGYFSITTSVTGNGIVTPVGTRYWHVNTGKGDTTPLDAAMYAFAPMGFGEKSYELTTLTLECTSGSKAGTKYDFLGDDDLSAVGTLTELKTTLLLTNAPEVFPADSRWTLTAAFGESSMTDDEGKNSHTLKVSSNKGDFGKVLVGYYDGSRELKMEPENGMGLTSVEVTMLNSSKATIAMIPSAPKDGKYYEVTGVSMKVGDGELELQALTTPFVVPATTENVEVVVTFEEFTQTGLGGETTYEATAMVADDDIELGDVGTLDGDGDFTPEVYVTQKFKESSTFLPAFVFKGAEEGKHLSSVEVFVGEREACERVEVNAKGDQTFFLILPNYHDNLRIEGHFTDAYAPTIQLSIVVQTEGEEADAGGEYSTLAWTYPDGGLMRSGQRCPLLITPNPGYVLASVMEDKAGVVSDLSGEVTGGVLEYVAIDGRLDTPDLLPITLTLTFAKADNTGGLGDNAAKKFSRLNMYVADSSLAQDGSGLTYIFNDLNTDKFFDDVVGEDAATAIAVDDYNMSTGSVNGQQSLFDTVKYGASYPMNVVGSTTAAGQRYGIEKVLVVTYYFGPGDDGVQVKKPLSWKLYHTNTPVFVLENVTTHTDVIAYFAPIGNGEDGTVTDGGYDPTQDYQTVTVGSVPQGMTQPAGATKVVKGSQFPVLFKVTTPEYVLRDATVAAGGRSTSIAKTLTADGTASSTYILKNIVADTNVVATYNQRPEPEIVRHAVSADVQILKDGAVTPLGNGPMPCRIQVDSGAGFAQKNIVKNGEGMGVALMEGSDLRFSLTRDEGYSRLDNLGLKWSDSSVKAYRVTEAMTDGSVRNVIYFTTDEDDLVGRQVYTSGEPLYAEGDAPADVNTDTSWYVSNLLCDVTLVPTYEKLERPVSPVVTDYWTLTTKVGYGFGQVLVNSADATGCTTKLKKGIVTTDDPLVVSFVPAAGYRIADVHVSTSTGNAFTDFWMKLQGFLGISQGDVSDEQVEAKLRQEAIDNGYITLLRMVTNYEITVDYEVKPGYDTPTVTLPDHVAVNVKYDPDKGVVTPDTGLVVNRDAEQQFVADPKEVDGAFYSVVGVRVSVGDDIAQEVRAVDRTSDLVKWDEDYQNVFVVDFSQLAWPTDQPDTAVTVEILFSDLPDTTPVRGGDGDDDDIPGSPPKGERKTVVMNVVTEGDAGTDDNGIGGVVSPRGEFVLVPPKDGEQAYKQRVDVIPGDDYEFSKIVSVVNGDEVEGAGKAYQYQKPLREGKGYFEVEADEPGTEVITVYFKLKPLSERLYSINVEAEVPDADRFIQPHGVLSLENTKSQTYSIDPDLGYQVVSITDMAVDENGDDVPLPEGVTGANWTRKDGDTAAVNELRVDPIRVNGKVVNRHVVVAFEEKEGVDHGINKSEKVNLHVQAYGPGSEYLSFEPAGDMTGVFKGTETKKMSYTYRFGLSDEGKAAGYGIYWVQVNGGTEFGSPENKTDLRPEGAFTFTTDNMTRQTNNLYVYVKKDPLYKPTGPTDPGTGPTDPTDPTDPPGSGGGDDQNKLVTVDYGCGNGGSIIDKNPDARTRAIDSTGGQLTGSLQVDPELPFVLLMTPNEGYVLDKIIMDNCFVIQPLWVAPDDGREAKIALESTMMVRDAARSARVLATFKKGDPDTFDPWDPTTDDSHAYKVDGSLIVEISPASSVEALVTSEGDSVRAADILDVFNPVAPFTPTTAKKATAASASDGYSITYDTVSKLTEERDVNIVVGPLIKWNDEDNSKSTLFTVDSVSGLQDGFTIEERPLPGAAEVSEDDTPYYSYYVIRGALDEVTTRNVSEAAGASVSASDDDAVLTDERAVAQADQHQTSTVRIGLRGLAFDEGVYPEFDSNGGGGGNGDTDDTTLPKGKVRLHAQVRAGQGTIVPTTTTVGTSWYDGNLTGPWDVAEGSNVSFKVEPAAGFVLTELSYNSIDALGNGSFKASTSTLLFKATTSTTVYASFAPKDSAEAMRTVTIEVQGGHGTTSPAPGKYQVEKGQPYPINFEPDDGYVPYRVWIDGQESYIAPTLGGWMLPAWWHDQTFKIEFAVAGTTPSSLNYLVQTGQNVADSLGTSLVRTGDNPWLPVVVLLLLLAGGAAFGGMRLMRASETAGRAAKYSVTKRDASRDDTEE